MYQLNQIPSETQIQKNIRQAVFGTHMFCPVCQSRNVVRYGERYRCRKCRTKFSLLSHTWLSNMKLGLEIFWFVLWCWISQVPVKQTMALTKLSEKTVRLWFDRFRSHLPEEENTLGKIIQLDEAYFGGETGEHSLWVKKSEPETWSTALYLIPIRREKMLGSFSNGMLLPRVLSAPMGQESIAELIVGGRSNTKQISTRNFSLKRQARSKEYLGSCAPLSEGCIIMSRWTSYHISWVNFASDFATQKSLKTRGVT